MLRELTCEEIGFVSGGADIVVIGGGIGGIDSRVRDELTGGTLGGALALMQFMSYGQQPSIGLSFEESPVKDTDGDGRPDNFDADPNDANIQDEIVVNGIRQDAYSEGERSYERYSLVTTGNLINAEYVDGSWILVEANNPTEDQIRFLANVDGLKVIYGEFVGMTPVVMAHLANALTDAGFNLSANPIPNFNSYFNQYQHLLNTGQVQGKSAPDFVNWLRGQIPAEYRPTLNPGG